MAKAQASGLNVAFVDIDDCLISNKTSQYNTALIERLKTYDRVYLVTGRTIGDIRQHVMQKGNPHEGWKDQLLMNVPGILEKRGLKIAGIATPHDQFADIETAGHRISTLEFAEHTPEQLSGAKAAYVAAEKQLNDSSGEPLVEFSRLSVRDDYVPMQLAFEGDTEKRGQLTHLVKNIRNSGAVN